MISTRELLYLFKASSSTVTEYQFVSIYYKKLLKIMVYQNFLLFGVNSVIYTNTIEAL